MSNNRTNLLTIAMEKFEQHDALGAIKLCTAYLKDHPNDIDAIRLKASALGIEGQLDEAIALITVVINSSIELEVDLGDIFKRGRWFLRNGENYRACSDFEKIINLSNQNNDAYYLQSTYVHLAYAYAILGDRNNAEKILCQLDEDVVTGLEDGIINKKYIENILEINQEEQ